MSGELDVRVRITNGFLLDVAFEVPPGVTVLFGPSGSGKSTTLAAIAGLVRPTSGSVRLGDEVWFDSEARIDVAVHLRRVAFVFQSLALFPHMTAVQNVAYGIDRALDRRVREERAVALLDRLRVRHLAERKPRTFSGGEAQRVALARALGTRPRVILLDEPFSALDRELRVELIADLRDSIRELNVPVVFVTHHRQEARALGERLVVLDRGRVQRVGSVGELAADLEGGTSDPSFDETPLDPDRMLKR
jgi:molybdate transport system ATP-binding protein